jgi:hypothetical protein
MKGNFYENERVALFIDGANLYSAAARLGFDIDYRACSRSSARRAGWSAPTTTRPGRGSGVLADPAVDRLARTTTATPWCTKPTKEFTDAMGRRKIKGNMDIEAGHRRARDGRAPRTT